MNGSEFLVLLAAIACIALVVAVTVIVMIARDLQHSIRKVNTMLPHCDKAIREMTGTLKEAHELISRTNHATEDVEVVVEKACDVASEVIDQIDLVGTAYKLITGRTRNGTSAESRRKHRG